MRLVNHKWSGISILADVHSTEPFDRSQRFSQFSNSKANRNFSDQLSATNFSTDQPFPSFSRTGMSIKIMAKSLGRIESGRSNLVEVGGVKAQKWAVSWTVNTYLRCRFLQWPSSLDWPSVFRFGTSTSSDSIR